MTNPRIIVTGNIPQFPNGGPDGEPCDAVDILATAAGMSPDSELHILCRADRDELRRLQTMQRYIAGVVGMRHLAQVLPRATEVIVFDGTDRERLVHPRKVGSILQVTDRLDIPVHYITGEDQFDPDYLSFLAINSVR